MVKSSFNSGKAFFYKMKLYIIFRIVYSSYIFVKGSSNSPVLKLLQRHIYHSFDGVPFHWFILESLEVCATSCLRVTRCEFVNYDYPSKRCAFWDNQQLSDAKKTDEPKIVLLDMEDWKEIMIDDPCSTRPCEIGQRCIPNRSSYICEEYCPCCNQPYFSSHYYLVSVSSVDDSSHVSSLGMLSDSGWLPLYGDPDPHVLVRFSDVPFLVKGILTRGDEQREGWVSQYTIETSKDCDNFTLVGGIYEGNNDSENGVINYISPPVLPKCLKLSIINYENMPSMRMELIGCFV